MWRALHGIIPLKCILANRHVGDSGSCPLCNQGAEDVLNLLFRCHLARDLWEMLGLDDLVTEAASLDRSGSVVLEYILRRDDNNMPGIQTMNLKEVFSICC
jgi:hypothetical protein